jgi:hypothetical protein
MQAICVPGLDMIGHQRRREAGGDGDDHIGLAHARQLHRLEGQADLLRHLLEARQHLGVHVPADDLLEGALFGAARSWNFAWWPAPIMPSTLASLRARCLIDTEDAAAVRSAVR